MTDIELDNNGPFEPPTDPGPVPTVATADIDRESRYNQAKKARRALCEAGDALGNARIVTSPSGAMIHLLVSLNREIGKYEDANGIPRSKVGDATPTFSVDYSDRAALPMLAARRKVLEQHGLMGPAREVTEQMAAVRAWQVANLDRLTPYPGVIPTTIEDVA